MTTTHLHPAVNAFTPQTVSAAAAPLRTLVVMPALRALPGGHQHRGSSFVLTRKFLDGVQEYARLWPGRVLVLIQRDLDGEGHMDPVDVHPDELPFAIEWLPGDQYALEARLRSASLVLASLVDRHIPLAQQCRDWNVPLVYVAEYSLETRRQIIRAQVRNPLVRMRRELWTVQLQRAFRRAVQTAAGVQCNGTPTYQEYRELNRRTIVYFDSRITPNQVISEARLRARLASLEHSRPLQLAFSGRLVRMKGAHHLPRIAAELRASGIDFRMHICGDGDLVPELRREITRRNLAHHVMLRGVFEFTRELIPFMQNNVDLFVCPHPQGDPSCTYLETMACGVPVVGYDNAAFRGIVQTSGVGWLSPLGNPSALAQRIGELARNRPQLAVASLQSREFALHHTFAQTMQQRVDHMRACAAPIPRAGVIS